ncbi:hypothetical protein [Sphingomonas sp. BK235]|uniref:hypothetical protein n=1 Tax=Sphingomonas sp. BK235 TaxID=2512131 RepID=UPI00104890C5|nr:hypothetical protein [Sphingomonas sp. BK235]TCP30709.1 hypothetical protein EV292_11266 [Sphingomonas sp. BK235]
MQHLPIAARPTAAASSSAEREQQRIAHLVLGAPRPRRKPTSKRKKAKAPTIELAPGIEERVQLRELYGHRQGTPETHHFFDLAQRQEGALTRLHRTGAIDHHQLAAAERIIAAHEQISADVAVRTAKWGARGSGGGPNAASAERIGAVLLEQRYTAWRAACAPHTAMLLAIIVNHLPLTESARRWRMSNRRARAVLVAGLDQWGKGCP